VSRPLRICYSGAWYHIIDFCRGRRKLFHDEKDRTYFLNLCANISEVYSAEIHAYCLLDQSFHLLIRTPQGNISDCMRHLLSLYTRYYNQLKRRQGALFSGRYKSVLIESDKHILQVSRVIHRLPREKKITPVISSYTWSSYRAYIGTYQPKPWLMQTELLDFFAKHNAAAMYRLYVETGDDPETDQFYRKHKLSAVLGSTEFKRQALARTKIDFTEVPQAKELIMKPSITEIITAVCTQYSIEPDAIQKSTKGRGKINIPRSIALSICRKLGGYSLKAIAKEFNLNHYSAVTVAIKRLDASMQSNNEINQTLEKIKEKLAA